jgi:hypothetical protein
MIDANSIENGPSGNICLPIVQSDSRCRALLLGRLLFTSLIERP